MSRKTEWHYEFNQLVKTSNYQEVFWASDLGYLWYEANYGVHNTYFEFAKSEIQKKGCTTLLDVGCGWGEFCFQCSKIEPLAEITGIDISEGVVNIAKKKRSASNITYLSKTIFDVDKPTDLVTMFGAPDYIPPQDFATVVEKAILLEKKEIILVNSLRNTEFDKVQTLKEAMEIKRYDVGYVQPLNYILESLKKKYPFEFKIQNYGMDSQIAIISK